MTAELEEGDRAIHAQYGSGTVEGVIDNDRFNGKRLIFKSQCGKEVNVAPDELIPFKTLLNSVDVNVKKEWVNNAVPYDNEQLHHGQINVDMDIAEGVELDVDAIHEDNQIIVQYWTKYHPTHNNEQ